MIDMDASELDLRNRVHRAYDAVAPHGPTPSRVIGTVHARAATARERHRRRGFLLAGAAGVAVFSVASVQIVPRTVLLRQGSSPMLAQKNALQGGDVAPAAAPTRTMKTLSTCSAAELLADVTTNLPTYGTGDVVTVSTTLSNRAQAACFALTAVPTVWITDASGRQWQLCPEPPPPTPTPKPTAGPPLAMNALVAPMAAGPPHLGALPPGKSLSTACTWHTSYTSVPAGTYTVHATWSSSIATATVSVAPSTEAPLTDYQP